MSPNKTASDELVKRNICVAINCQKRYIKRGNLEHNLEQGYLCFLKKNNCVTIN